MALTTAAEVRTRADQLPDLLKRQELADYTGISVQTFARWVGEKKGPRMTKLGGACRYAKADVLAWIEASAA